MGRNAIRGVGRIFLFYFLIYLDVKEQPVGLLLPLGGGWEGWGGRKLLPLGGGWEGAFLVRGWEGAFPLRHLPHNLLKDFHWRRLALVLRRVIQHARADAEFPVLHLQNGVVDAATATAPKSIVVRQLVETHRHVTQCCVHLHHRIATRQRENLRMRPTHTSQRERVVLDALGDVPALIVGMHNQT